MDSNQYLGTLIGLKSRLVLCGLKDHAKKYDRIVIIPFGEPLATTCDGHIKVEIMTLGRSVKFFSYRHDTEHKRLYGNGEMLSALFKAYLHALTSYIYPDPFTGYTGTDEALASLKEQLIRCSEPLDEDSTKLVALISALTPSREYYPKTLRAMQKVHWHPVASVLAQHDDFYDLAEQIVISANSAINLYPEGKTASLRSSSNNDLLQRARFRNSNYRSSEFGGNMSYHDADKVYQARDRSVMNEKIVKVYEIASLIVAWPSRLDITEDLFEDLLPLGTISGVGKACSTSRPISELLELSFASSWAPLQELCLSSSRSDRYALTFLFSMIAYSPKVNDIMTLKTLLAFVFTPELKRFRPPPYSFFNLNSGCAPTELALRNILKNHEVAFKAPRGTPKPERTKQRAAHKKRVERQIGVLVRAAMAPY